MTDINNPHDLPDHPNTRIFYSEYNTNILLMFHQYVDVHVIYVWVVR